jgi:hypothetical protein
MGISDGIDWAGPACPACKTEMNAEAFTTARGIRICQRCPACDLVLLVTDPFALK